MNKELIKKDKLHCPNCGKLVTNKHPSAKPCRHFTSPNTASYVLYFCNQDCINQYQKDVYRGIAEIDRNASDSECFIHDHWEGKMRVGKCRITGKEVRVEPLQPGDNSGQPIECYEHFKLHSRYLTKLS